MVSATVIGAIVGVIIGIVLLIVLITCIIYISRKLKKKTNSRSKIISSNGVVIKDKWAEDEDVKKYFTEEENRTRRKIVRPEVIAWYDSPFVGRLPEALKANTHFYGTEYASEPTNIPISHHPKLFYRLPTNAVSGLVPLTGFHTVPLSGWSVGGSPTKNDTMRSGASKAASLPTVRTLRPMTLRDVDLPPLGREPQPTVPNGYPLPSSTTRGRPTPVMPYGLAAAAQVIPAAVTGWSSFQRPLTNVPLERLIEEPANSGRALAHLGNSAHWPPELDSIMQNGVTGYVPRNMRSEQFPYLRPEFPSNVSNDLRSTLHPGSTPNAVNELPGNIRQEVNETALNLRNEIPENVIDELSPNLGREPFSNLGNELPSNLTNDPTQNLTNELPPNLRRKLTQNSINELPPNLRNELPGNLRGEPPSNMRNALTQKLKNEFPPHLKNELSSDLKSEPSPRMSNGFPTNLTDEPPSNLRGPPQNLRTEFPTDLRDEPHPNLRKELSPNLPTELSIKPRNELSSNMEKESHPDTISENPRTTSNGSRADGLGGEIETRPNSIRDSTRNPETIVPEGPIRILKTPPRKKNKGWDDDRPTSQLSRDESKSYNDMSEGTFRDEGGENSNDRMYFGHIDRTEHVEVKEKRRREEVIIPPEPQPLPPPPPPVVVPPPSPPRPQQPRLARYRIRSWTKRQRDPPPLKRRGSTGNGEGIKDFVYGIPYPVSSWSPIPAQPTQPTPAAPPPPPPQPLPSAPPVPNPAVECVQPEHKCQSIEEQERVLVIDDTMTERSFNTRYNSRVSAIVDNHVTAGVTQSMTNQVENCTREHLVPKIITDLV